ncbi:INO80 complex subunit D-like isoform X2 [Ptychodera flava]|uniref:INO80 complex subunit D-like isoform X2 n=2 Tax=Ptychodera flava TaxID=63121 RepID=UPI00396A8628
MLDSKNEDQRKCDVGSKVMYEGKHIHYSEADNKPLCSYSTKLCKQRRLNGYAFCIRHVLEDKTAPFKQCEYVAKYNNQRCTNPIPKNEDRIYCNSHLQVLGIVPKKERKRKSGESPDKKVKDVVKEKEKKKEKPELTVENHNEVDSEPDVYTFIPSPPSVERKPPPKSPRPSTGPKEKLLKAKLQDKITKNKLKLEKEREKELKAKVNNSNKLNLASRVPQPAGPPIIPPVPTPSSFPAGPLSTFQQPPAFPTIPPYHHPFPVPPMPVTFSDLALPWFQAHTSQSLPIVQVRPKRPRQLKSPKRTNKCLEKLLNSYRSREEKNFDLFPLGYNLSDDEEDESDDYLPWQQTRIDDCDSDSSSCEDFEISTRRSQRVDSLESQLRREYSQLRHCKHSHKSSHRFHQSCGKSLIEAIRKGPRETLNVVLAVRNQSLKTRLKRSQHSSSRCSYEGETEELCQEKALPFTRHCVKHIMCNKDQVLFAYCTAKFPGGVQCSVPVFDIVNERPLCEEHARKMANVQKGEANRKALLADGKAPPRRPRKKTKPSALTRPSKKKKKKKQQRRNARPQKPVPPAKPSGNTEMPQTLNLGIDTSQLSPAPDGIDTEDITDHLDNDLSTDVIGKNLELHIDPTDLSMDDDALHMDGDGLHMDNDALNSDHQSDLEPDKHLLSVGGADFEEWGRLPDDLNDLELFAGKNGVFAPTKEEEEALERALKEASEDVKASLAQLTHHLSPETQGLPNLILPSGHDNHNSNHIISDSMVHSMDMGSTMAYTVTPVSGSQGSFQEGRGSVQNSAVQSPANVKNDLEIGAGIMNHGMRDMNQDPVMTNNRRFNTDVSTLSPHSAPISPHGNHFQADVPRTLPHDAASMLNHQMLNSPSGNLLMANQRPWNYTALNPSADHANLLSVNHQNNGPSALMNGPPPYSPNPGFIQANKFNVAHGHDQVMYNQISQPGNRDQPLQTQSSPMISSYSMTTATAHQQSTS